MRTHSTDAARDAQMSASVVRTHSTDAYVRFADAVRAVTTTSASCFRVCVFVAAFAAPRGGVENC